MRKFSLFLLVSVFVFVSACMAAMADTPPGTSPDGMNYTYSPSEGYRVFCRATHPGPLAGTQITLSATATYTNETGQIMGEAQSETLVVNVANTVWKRTWNVVLPEEATVVLDSGSGPGGMSLNGNNLTVWLFVPNNGVQQQFSWRLMLKPPARASSN